MISESVSQIYIAPKFVEESDVLILTEISAFWKQKPQNFFLILEFKIASFAAF